MAVLIHFKDVERDVAHTRWLDTRAKLEWYKEAYNRLRVHSVELGYANWRYERAVEKLLIEKEQICGNVQNVEKN